MLDRFIIGAFRIAFATWWWWLAKIFGDNKLRLLSANWAFCTSFACSWYRNDGSSPFPSLRLVAVLCWLLWLWPRFCCFAVAWFLLICVGRYSTHIWPGDVHFNLTLGFCVSFFLPPSCAFGMLLLFCLFFAFVLFFFVLCFCYGIVTALQDCVVGPYASYDWVHLMPPWRLL